MTVVEIPHKLTYEDYHNFPDDGNRYEIIDGELYVNPSPNMKHQLVLMNILRALDRYVRAHSCGEIFFAPFDVVLSKHNIVQPDVLYISNERFGVSEYWIVDPIDEDSVRIVRFKDRKFERRIVGGNITTPLLPGFALPLRDVFAMTPSLAAALRARMESTPIAPRSRASSRRVN